MNHNLRAAMLAACWAAAMVAPAAASEAEERSYRMELEAPGQEWVVISYHFRHSNACTTYGCVIIGPTEDEEACKAWARAYNTADPTDHARCVNAEPYELLRY